MHTWGSEKKTRDAAVLIYAQQLTSSTLGGGGVKTQETAGLPYLQLVHDGSNTDDRCGLVGEHAGVAVQGGQALAVCIEGVVVEGHELVRDILEIGSHRHGMLL